MHIPSRLDQRPSPPAGKSAVKRRAAALLAAAVLSLAPLRSTRAVTDTYTGPDGGNWNTAANWTTTGSTHVVPANGDDAVLNGNATITSVNFNANYSGNGLNSLTLDSPGTGSMTLKQTAASTLIAGTETIGNTTHLNAYTQSAGTNTVTGVLTIANGSNATGNYTLSGGNLNTATTGSVFTLSENIGESGTGTFTQSGGSHTVGTPAVNQTLIIGDQASGLGTYTMNNTAATLTVNGTELLGAVATGTTGNGMITQYGGTFIQSAGNHTVTDYLTVGFLAGSTGSFTLSGGNLTVATTGPAFGLTEVIGQDGTGAFTQSGGNHTVGTLAANQDLYIGQNADAIGTYTMNNAAATLTVNGTELVGASATGSIIQFGGSFMQSAGNHTVTEYLTVGYLAGSTGSFALSGGNLSVATNGAANSLTEVIGQAGTGVFTQSGGNHTIGTPAANQVLHVGQTAGAVGTYSMTNTASILTVNGTLLLGTDSGATGSFFLSNGTLTVTGPEFIGNSGTGTFIQSGGTNTIGSPATTSNNLDLGALSGAVGTYTVNNANAMLTLVNGSCNVGGISTAAGGTGTLNVSAGTVTINGPIKTWTTGSAVNLSGGTLSVQSLDTSGVPSRFNWTGGTLNFINGFTLDANFTLGPSLTLGLGKTLAAPAGQTITNNGSFTLAGGAVNAPTIINNTSLSGFGSITASSFANNGQITLSGGSLAINLSSAPFANTGAISLAPGFQLQLTASSAANDGTINLNGGAITGSLPFTNASDGVITGPGNISATFINQGTLFAPTGTTKVGSFTNTGVIEMSGAAAQLGSGGTITNNALIEGFGKISDSVINSATIQPTGGTLNISGTLTNPAAGLLAASTGNTLLVSSGLAVNAGIISLTGGTFDNGNQPLNNTGQITGYGTLRTGGGGLTNNNAVTFTGGTSTINGPVTNALNKTLIAKNDPAIFTGPVTNNGTILVTNTTITFAGPYSGNAYISDPSTNIFQSSATITTGGSMTGGASDQFIFAGPFTNNGNFTNAGTLQVTASITNTATFTQSGPQSWSPGAIFTNTTGTATFASNAKLYGLNITAGTVDITNSKFIIEPTSKSTTLAALQQNIANHSLTSSTLPPSFGLALVDNAVTLFTTFGNQPADANSLLLSEELLGDANLDGNINLSDLSTILNDFGQTTPLWTSGNFDHASSIDLTDLSDVLNNFGASNPDPTSSPFILQPSASPEPATFLLLTISSLFSTRPIRRRHLIGTAARRSRCT